MTLPILIDTNIPLYAAGRSHPLKQPCADILLAVAAQSDVFVTDAEVLQELLHVYLSRGGWSLGQPVFNQFTTLMGGRVEPIHAADVERAAGMAAQHAGLSARDLIHLAVMVRQGLDHIVTADRDFDRLPGIHRLDPADFHTWRTGFNL